MNFLWNHDFMDQFIFQRKRSFWAQTAQSVMPPCRMSLTAEVIGYIVRVEQAERIISVCCIKEMTCSRGLRAFMLAWSGRLSLLLFDYLVCDLKSARAVDMTRPVSGRDLRDPSPFLHLQFALLNISLRLRGIKSGAGTCNGNLIGSFSCFKFCAVSLCSIFYIKRSQREKKGY